MNNIPETKEELLEQIKEKEMDISDLHAQIDKLEKYKQYEKSANEIKAMYDSFVNAGFSEDQAFTIMLKFIENAKPNNR